MMFRYTSSLCISVAVLCYAAAGQVQWQCAKETCTDIVRDPDPDPDPEHLRRSRMISIEDLGGVGDGKTLNTNAFRDAINRIELRRNKNSSLLLYIPSGVYLTGPFNLTSHMTLYLARGSVIKATQDTDNWPVVDPLPSYGRGRELPGGRYTAFILGNGVHHVTITGENGTIDGQGDVWWNMWKNRNKTTTTASLQYTRPHLIEFMHSSQIIISNVTLKNSPFWTIHPVYCSHVVVHHATILAPRDSPNTDGVDPDSSSNICIEDCYISTGDDLVAVKSGWDEYGISYGRPSTDITVRRIAGSTSFAGIAVGSETSGGIENVLIEHLSLYSVAVGVHIKTNTGRGGFVRNITATDIHMEEAKLGIKIAGDVGGHPDDKFNPQALPLVSDIVIKNVWGGDKVRQPGLIKGIKDNIFTNISLFNVSFYLGTWNCCHVRGTALQVSPRPCSELSTEGHPSSDTHSPFVESCT